MEPSKVVGDLIVDMKYQATRSPRACFVVFSSREKHVEIVIDCVERVFQETRIKRFDVQRLDTQLKSGDSQYAELTDLLSTCAFAVVILDGFRPNVLFEFGILKGLGKPCIVLLSHGATIDIVGFFPDNNLTLPPAPEVDMDKHFSDVKDRFYLRYDKNNPKQIRATLQGAYKNLEQQIESQFLRSMFPHKDLIERELKAHLTAIVAVLTKKRGTGTSADIGVVDAAHSHLERIAKEHSVILPPRYFSVLAHAYDNAKAPEKAVAVIDHCLTGKADDVALLSDKAFILRRAGKPDESIRALDDAIRLRPRAEFLWHNKAITLDQQGHAKEAEACYKKAILLDSGCASLHFHYGILLFEKDQVALALREFTRAVRMRPEDIDFRLWRARALDSNGKTIDARKIVEKILAEKPGNADAWFVLGHLERTDRKALECYEKAVSINPKHGGALCSLAARLSNMGRHDEALVVFARMGEACRRHQTCPTLISNICTTLGKVGRSKEGLRACNKLLSGNPNNVGALKAKACCLARLGKYKQSTELFSVLLAKTPNDADLLYNQACAHALAGHSDDAAQSLARAIGINDDYRDMARRDPDFKSIRPTTSFRRVIQIGRRARSGQVLKSPASEKIKGSKCPTRSFSVRASARR